jgi:predicted DNA-binding transcriptional regulator AlpA
MSSSETGAEPMSELPHLISAETLALSLGQSKKWIYRQHSERGMPAIKLGRSLLFDPSAVLRWLDRQQVGDWENLYDGARSQDECPSTTEAAPRRTAPATHIQLAR